MLLAVVTLLLLGMVQIALQIALVALVGAVHLHVLLVMLLSPSVLLRNRHPCFEETWTLGKGPPARWRGRSQQ